MSMNICRDDIFWSAEPFPPNLVFWCIILSQIVFQKDWFAVFKVKVTVKDYMIKMWLSNISSELLALWQLNLVWWHIITSWIVLWKDWIALLWSRLRLQERFKIPVNVHLADIPSTAEPSVTKLGMVMHHLAPVSCRKIGLLSSRSRSVRAHYQIWLFLPHLLNYWFLQPNLIGCTPP